MDSEPGFDASGVDSGGAGDQGVVVGCATEETPELLPQEYMLARSLCQALKALREGRDTAWLRADGKSQVTLLSGKVNSVVLAAHHDARVSTDKVRDVLRTRVVEPILGPQLTASSRVVINGTGKFTIGGPRADAGVVGRKIVVDTYGPRVPVGGGAYSGKGPSKVDRSAAYIARHIAKAVVLDRLVQKCMVVLAFSTGQKQPEMVSVIAPLMPRTWSVGLPITSKIYARRPLSNTSVLAVRKDGRTVPQPPSDIMGVKAFHGNVARRFPWKGAAHFI
jgi:S-adenosylmethionine synthetase